MSNPFDDLKDDSEPTDSAETADTANTTDTTAATGTPPDGSSESETSDSPTENSSSPNEESNADRSDHDVTTGSTTEPEPVSPAETGPAFEYSDVQQKPFYARSETVDEFENAIRTTIVPKLAEASVLDEQTREIHDAVLRFANEHPERVAELVLEERRRSESQ